MSQTKPQSEIVTIERIVPGGDGLGRLSSGELVFVRRAAPGDALSITNITRKKGVARGEIEDIIRPGPERIEPRCQFVSRCGGCDLMHLSPAGQRSVKLEILQDALRRIGGDPERPRLPGFVHLGDGFSYRSRLRLHVDPRGNVGLLSRHSTEVVLISECLVSVPVINRALSNLAEASLEGRQRLAFCSEIELRAADLEPQLLARLFARPKSQLRSAAFQPLFAPGTLIVIAGSPEDAQSLQKYKLFNELELSIPAAAFSQVHWNINNALVGAVVRAATLRGLRSFVDAYAGAGNFALPLLAAGLTGEAIDSTAAGILAARRVARDRGLPFSGFQIGEAMVLLDSFARIGRQFDLVLLDPPRAGAKEVLPVALRLHPQVVVLVACDPVSLARDLKMLVAAGGKIEELTVFDMFPQTHHVEMLAIVEMGKNAETR
jgi:23S rRNA (uracil1939-C5)-methyltransferase